MSIALDPSAPADFDFIIGDWRVRHRRLKERFTNSSECIEFAGRSSTSKVLGGYGNIEDNILEFPEADFRAIAVRSYCRESRNWSIWWLDGRNPTQLDTPVVGSFQDGAGIFLADDVLNGQAIKVRFKWLNVAGDNPKWEQAFSNDGGATWETNWWMEFLREENELQP